MPLAFNLGIEKNNSAAQVTPQQYSSHTEHVITFTYTLENEKNRLIKYIAGGRFTENFYFHSGKCMTSEVEENEGRDHLVSSWCTTKEKNLLKNVISNLTKLGRVFNIYQEKRASRLLLRC